MLVQLPRKSIVGGASRSSASEVAMKGVSNGEWPEEEEPTSGCRGVGESGKGGWMGGVGREDSFTAVMGKLLVARFCLRFGLKRSVGGFGIGRMGLVCHSLHFR